MSIVPRLREYLEKERVAYRFTPRVETLVDEEVPALPEIVFRSGSHHELVAMPYWTTPAS